MGKSCASLYWEILTRGVGYSRVIARDSHPKGPGKDLCPAILSLSRGECPLGQSQIHPWDSWTGVVTPDVVTLITTLPPMEHSGIISARALRSLIRLWPQLHLFIPH